MLKHRMTVTVTQQQAWGWWWRREMLHSDVHSTLSSMQGKNEHSTTPTLSWWNTVWSKHQKENWYLLSSCVRKYIQRRWLYAPLTESLIWVCLITGCGFFPQQSIDSVGATVRLNVPFLFCAPLLWFVEWLGYSCWITEAYSMDES